MAISSPYNFVPLNKHVYIPSWHDQVSQDIPFEDGEDGWIEVKWRNESPLFIRDASFSHKKEECVYSMHIEQSEGKRLYFIPGSSMKGMLRSILTIMSYGKMAQYNNCFFGYREFDTKVSEGKKYQAAMLKAQVGWLEKQYDKSGNETYLLHPCIEERKTIDIQEVSKLCAGYDHGKTSWLRNKTIKEHYGTFFPKIKAGYRLFCTGWMGNKKHEMLIPSETSSPINLCEKTVRAFLTVYGNKVSPDFNEYLNLLEKGERIPVSYVCADNGEVKALGLGRMFRYPYQYDVRSLVEKEQAPAQDANIHDLLETIFGWTNHHDSVKGRVQFSNAFAATAISDEELAEVSGVLGQPKASFYPLYIKQDTNRYNTYEDAPGIAGRKQYRIHKDGTTTEMPKGNGNENTTTRLRPVPAGNVFSMRINLHNLRPIETGALLWAITFNDTPQVWHNIGQAKSFGYGKIAHEQVVLHGLQLSKEEYIMAFEAEMTQFTLSHNEGTWVNTPSITALANILSEHSDSDLRMMELKEYADYRRNTNFSKLQEGGKHFLSTISHNEIYRIRNAETFSNAALLLRENKLSEAKEAYGKIIDQMLLQGIDCSSEEKVLADINARIAQQQANEKALKEAEIQQQKEAKLTAGLAAVLDETYEQGQNAGQYKIKEWKVCKQKVDRWLRDKNAETLDKEEQKALAATVKRIKNNPVKKEIADWKNFNSKLWQSIKAYLGEELSQSLFANHS